MSKFLHATGANSRVYKTITPVDEVWVTLDLSFNNVTGNDFVQLWDPTVVTALQGVIHDIDWQEDQQLFVSSATPAAQPLGTFQTVEVHHLKGVSEEAWVDGSLLWSGIETTGLQVGEIDIGGGTTWIDNVKIGSTRGASDIFFDGFESGDVSAWDGSYGTVSVVSTVAAGASAAQRVSVSFSTGALDPPVYTDLANDPYRLASGWRIDRGRSSEFDKTVTGTANVDFNDTEGVLDPTNPGSPFVGTIDPMRQVNIALRNPNSGVWNNLFTGFCSEWQYDVDISEKFSRVALECADAFDLLAALEMTPGHHGDTTPAESAGDIAFDQGPPGIIGGGNGPSRIHKALDDAGWPSGRREIFPGNVVLQQTIYTRLDQLLSVLFDAADAEFPGVANVYVNKNGYVTFHGRYTRFDPTNALYGIQTWKVGDTSVASGDASFAPFSGLSFRRSKADLINVSVCTPQIPAPGGEFTSAELSAMTVKDDTSIASYAWRAAHYENLLTLKGRSDPTSTTFDVEAKDEVKLYSEFIVNNYKDPRTRVEQLVFRSRSPEAFSGPATWDLLCGVEIGDIVHLENSHPGGGGFNEDFFVEGIHYDAKPMTEGVAGGFPEITLTLDVSPKSLYDFNPFA